MTSKRVALMRAAATLAMGSVLTVMATGCGADDPAAGGTGSGTPAPSSEPSTELSAEPSAEPASAPASEPSRTPRTTASTEQADGGAEVDEPCEVTDPATVAAVFGGNVTAERPGTLRNCTYPVSGGAVGGVEVYYYGTAPEWDGIREGYETNRGPLTKVSGVGDEAFNPGDLKTREIVVRAGQVVFAVGLSESGKPSDGAMVKALAVRIARAVG